MTRRHYTALRLFRYTVAFGFVINTVGFIVPALFAPRSFEALAVAIGFDFGHTNTLHWLQNTALLLAIVTAMYIPVISDPFRYLFSSIVVVVGRFSAGALFLLGVLFMNYPKGEWLLAGPDLVLSSIQVVLLYLMLKDGDPRAAGRAAFAEL
jgi:hypothetical protein